jgi:hypothetical protein
MSDDQQQTLYDRVGGDEFFVRLVDAFYDGVAVDDVLLPLYPEPDDLGRRGGDSRCSWCSTGEVRRPTTTSVATLGCACGTSRSTSDRSSATAGCTT